MDDKKNKHSNYDLRDPKVNFLVVVDSIMEQIRYRHISFEEGYDRLWLMLTNDN